MKLNPMITAPKNGDFFGLVHNFDIEYAYWQADESESGEPGTWYFAAEDSEAMDESMVLLAIGSGQFPEGLGWIELPPEIQEFLKKNRDIYEAKMESEE